MPVSYPPVSFHVKMTVLGVGSDDGARFTDVAGLSLATVTEPVAEEHRRKAAGRRK